MEISESDRDAYVDLLYDMYDIDMVDLCIETLGENELFDGIPALYFHAPIGGGFEVVPKTALR